MANLRNTLEDFLQETRVLIGNSQTVPEISGALKDFGYTPERLAEGQTLLQAASSLVLKQRKEYGDQYEATAAAQSAWDAADRAYIKALKKLDTGVGELRTVLKVALADDPRMLEAVGISVAVGGRPKKKAATAVKV